MEKISVRFKREGSYNQKTRSDAADLITRLVSPVVQMNLEQGVKFDKLANQYFDEQKPKVIELLLADFPTYPFTDVTIESFKPVMAFNQQRQHHEVHWVLEFNLSSKVFTCINILADKTIVCHKKDDTLIQFIKIEEGMTLELK
jgi:hypothetical protein